MRIIYKYELDATMNSHEGYKLSLPIGAKVIDVGFQGSSLCIWALVNTENKREKHTFHVYGTGQSIDREDLEYVGHARLVLTRLNGEGYLEYFIFRSKWCLTRQ